MSERDRYEEATQLTGDELRTIARAPAAQQLSSLTLPEIDQIVNRIARVAPAGNVPGFILNGLLRRNRSQLRAEDVRRDVQLLFKGVEQMLRDKAIFSAFYAGPAAVLWAYQNLLQLAGLNANAFPEGTWQFYADYALRDDTARHACETHGFATTLRRHGITLSPADRLAAWVMTAVYTLHQYDDLLANEWRERVYTDRLAQVTADLPEADQFAGLYRAWEKERPYRRDADADPRRDYPHYRRQRFDAFLAPWLDKLPPPAQRTWQQRIDKAESHDLPAYQKQMSIRAYLEPERYGERRVPIPLSQIHVGVIVDGRYYLLPACRPDSERPPTTETIRTQIATLLAHPAETHPADLSPLAGLKRTAQAALRREMPRGVREEIDMLRLAPIWINVGQRPRRLPLSAIRQAERGLGDHPLTIFNTGETVVFDLSHIFFDGAWGVALAEIMTNEALSWAAYLRTLPPPQPGPERPYTPRLTLSSALIREARGRTRVATEASVETADIDLDAIRDLRRRLKQRSAWLKLTVNDLLILYRAIHAARYQPDPALVEQLRALQRNAKTRDAATEALAAVAGPQRANPAILIPVDATRRHPANRVYPLTFSVPLEELDLLAHHRATLEAQADYAAHRRDRKRRRAFVEKRQQYLVGLAGFGELMDRVKKTAVRGESVSVKNIQLLANLPTGWQRLLDEIPNRFDVLNDLIKGREVFSNVGQMAPGSSVCRFITAKDDNEKKTLAWGVMSDAAGRMILTLRDFRPHVAALTAAGEEKLAWRLARDYLVTYAQGLNEYVAELRQIVK